MRRRLRKIDGQWVWETFTTDYEEKSLQQHVHEAASRATKTGGVGSDNMRYVGSLSGPVYAQMVADWNRHGGHKGTGMPAKDWCLLKMSTGDYSKNIGTPSGRTGYERKARRKTYRA